jgi:hypothetical protein
MKQKSKSNHIVYSPIDQSYNFSTFGKMNYKLKTVYSSSGVYITKAEYKHSFLNKKEF